MPILVNDKDNAYHVANCGKCKNIPLTLDKNIVAAQIVKAHMR